VRIFTTLASLAACSFVCVSADLASPLKFPKCHRAGEHVTYQLGIGEAEVAVVCSKPKLVRAQHVSHPHTLAVEPTAPEAPARPLCDVEEFKVDGGPVYIHNCHNQHAPTAQLP